MSLQVTNTLATIIKSGLAFIIIAITIFYLPPIIGAPDQTILAVVDIVDEPEIKATNHKKSNYQPKHDKVRHKKLSKQISRKIGNSSNRIKISGYRGKTFVYGEVIPLENGKLQGFIYHPNDSKTYVYGEKGKDTMNLYDNSGNLYQMLY